MDEKFNGKSIIGSDKLNKKKKSSKKILIISLIIILAVLVGLLLFKILFLGNKSENKDKNGYYILGDTIDLKENNLTNYIFDYYVVEKDGKSALMDENGNLKTDFVYDFLYKEGNVIIAYVGDNHVILDKDTNVILDNLYPTENPYCYNDYIEVNKDGGNYILDKNGKIILEKYDSIICANSYFIATKDNKTNILNKKGELVLENVEVDSEETIDFPDYKLNDNFAVLKENGKYVVYYFKTAKKSKEYDYASLIDDYVAVTDKNKIIVKGKSGRTVYKYDAVYKNYKLIQKDMIFVPNDKCTSEDPELFGDLYNKNKKITKKGCNTIDFYDGYVYVKDENNLHTVYHNSDKVLEKKGSKDSYLYKNDYGNYSYYNGTKNQVLTSKGNAINKDCNNLTQYSKNVYKCQITTGIEQLYNKNKKIDNVYYSTILSSDDFITVTNTSGKEGLYDKYGNKIINEEYDNIIVNDKFISLEKDGKKTYKKLKKVDKNTYNKYLNTIKKEKVEDEKSIDYDSININDVINKYDLSNLKNLINNNEMLFKKVSYHVINNNNMTDSDKKYFLGMFDIIVKYDKYNKIEMLLDKIDTLKVEVYDKRPDDMYSFAVGMYYPDTNRVSLLTNNYDYAIRHEFMHFISYSAINPVKEFGAYKCSNKIYTYDEALELSMKNQAKCEYNAFSFSNGLEEAGAEYFTRVVSKNETYQSYYYTNVAYNLLQYILEDDFEDVEYSCSKGAKLYKILNEKLNYDATKASELINSLDNINNVEKEQFTDKGEIAYYHYKIADQLIELYKSKNIGSWKDNNYMVASINSLVDQRSKYNLDKFLRNNEALKIENYNDLINRGSDEYIQKLVKNENINYYSYSWRATRDKDQFIILIDTRANDGNYEIKVYYDKYGNVKDTKVKQSLEPLG